MTTQTPVYEKISLPAPSQASALTCIHRMRCRYIPDEVILQEHVISHAVGSFLIVTADTAHPEFHSKIASINRMLDEVA